MKRTNDMTIKEVMSLISAKIAEIESRKEKTVEDCEALETLEDLRDNLGRIENTLDEIKGW